MSEERKKAQPKPVVKVEPKKRVETKPVVKAEPKKKVEPKIVEEVKPIVDIKKKAEPKQVVKPVVGVKKKVVEQPIVDPKILLNTEEKSETRAKRAENKYVRIALDAKGEERNEFSTKVKNGELKFAYYATDNDKGYHYYIVLKK